MLELDNDLVVAAGENGAYPIDFVKIEVDPDDSDKIFLMNNGFKSFTFGGDTYAPAGHLLEIAKIDSTSEARTNPITLSLSGIDDTVVAILNTEPIYGSKVTIYRSLFDEDSGDLVSTPYIRWSGVVVTQSSTTETSEQGTHTIAVTCKSLLESILESVGGRYTSQPSFQEEDSDDLTMEFVGGLSSWNPRFGGD